MKAEFIVSYSVEYYFNLQLHVLYRKEHCFIDCFEIHDSEVLRD